ncbi:MAG: phosphoenolpyruvate mutase [Candidatus Marinimicrobia bacterium]|nr:phosphoenolpyruvate mutase [Candidatus Neomarinimicrobiota bacterium]MCF7829248.1 phosphoenolpyruvate mutase [Candidatus Neomarinimicrobiota bacterium]MCF7881099.1 phosphoenolpyruvate mutase [Candidatus Neomarinimicrobiota bacterium]
MTLRNIITPEKRRSRLKELIAEKGFVRIIEAHNGISALIGNNSFIEVEEDDETYREEFDGLWESSLTDTASKGYPDAEIVGIDSRLMNITQILDVTNKPLIVDGDTGGDASHFEYMVKRFEALGISAVIIEDKVFPKRNSLSGDAKQDLEDPETFATKIRRGKAIQSTDDFMIIARLESLIAGHGVKDAVRRAKQYLQAGADGIMIHSKVKDPADVFRFSEEYDKLSSELGERKPLVCVPTAYNHVPEQELVERGFNVIIHANHMLRSSVKAMENVAKNILINKRSLEADPYCTPVKEIFNLVGFTDVKEKDAAFSQKAGLTAIIPAAGKSRDFDDPKALISVNSKTVLEHQMETLKRCGVEKTAVIRGYKRDEFPDLNISYYDNPDYDTGFSVDSLFHAEEAISGKLLFVNSDVLFNEFIIKNLVDTNLDIVIAIDGTYKYHKHMQDKVLDLVVAKSSYDDSPRRLISPIDQKVLRIGKQLDMEQAEGEYTGIAYFSEDGAEHLKTVYHDCKDNTGKFHEAESFKKASMTDMLQEMIDRGYDVHFLEVNKGWLEIHNPEDKKAAEVMLTGV